MVRRRKSSFISGPLLRAIGSFARRSQREMTRAVQKAGTQVVKAAARSAAKKRAPGTAKGKWISGVSVGSGGPRRYRVFVPQGVTKRAPLPVIAMLHGCGQDAASFARSTRMHLLAARDGVLLVFPEQERLANAQGCWNWFEHRSGRAPLEADSILAAIDQACLLHGGDRQRIAVAGFSAGASMAALIALRHPDRIRAVVMHSGVAPTAAQSMATGLAAMRGHRRPEALPQGLALPPLLVLQGSSDRIVSAVNGQTAVDWWAAAFPKAKAGTAREIQRGQRHPMTLTEYGATGQVVAALCEVQGMGHDWSGGASGQPFSDPSGPDASRLIWSFVMKRI